MSRPKHRECGNDCAEFAKPIDNWRSVYDALQILASISRQVTPRTTIPCFFCYGKPAVEVAYFCSDECAYGFARAIGFKTMNAIPVGSGQSGAEPR